MKTKKKIIKSGKKQRDYCKACLEIRKGSDTLFNGSEESIIPHTCRKSRQEMREYIYHMNIFYVMRRREISERGYDSVCGDY